MSQNDVVSTTTRKSNKPLMEKRRRARINRSLAELKAILLDSFKKPTAGHSKWEKADILDMTVQYLHCLRDQQKIVKTDPFALGQFIAGFSECMKEVQKCTALGAMAQPAQQQMLQRLLLYLKNFSDDATRAMQCGSQVSDGHICGEPQTTPTSKTRAVPCFTMVSELLESNLSNSSSSCSSVGSPSGSSSSISPRRCTTDSENQSCPNCNPLWRPW